MAMPSDFDTEIIWGAAAIGRLIGRSTRDTFHLLKTGQLKGARKVGGRWCITRRALFENFQPPGPSGPIARLGPTSDARGA